MGARLRLQPAGREARAGDPQLGRQGMMGGTRRITTASCFLGTDFTEDLKKITVPVLVMHSEDDQIVPMSLPGRCPPSSSSTAR